MFSPVTACLFSVQNVSLQRGKGTLERHCYLLLNVTFVDTTHGNVLTYDINMINFKYSLYIFGMYLFREEKEHFRTSLLPVVKCHIRGHNTWECAEV